MKKLLAILLTLCLCLFEALPAFAAAPALTASSVNAAPGEPFDLPLKIENNPGFCYLKITFTYDADLLTLEAVTNGAVSTDAFTVTDKALQWDSDADVTASGVLATLRFTAKRAGSAAS